MASVANQSMGSAPQLFDDEVSLEYRDDVAIVVLRSSSTSGAFHWGTSREEHRWNPVLVSALGKALDAVEKSQASAMVLGNEGKFWSNGMDLKYLDTADELAITQIDHSTSELMTRLCLFPLPTVAALAGHWVAAGGMMGLTFDFRVMASDRGFFFIPGIDLGLVYSPLQMSIMKAKLPVKMHRDVILFNTKRWTAQDLLEQGVVDAMVPAADVLEKAVSMASSLAAKGRGPARATLGGIKSRLYSEVVPALGAGGEMHQPGRLKGVDRAAPPLPSKL